MDCVRFLCEGTLEEKLGLIPRVTVRGFSPKEYGLLVTDRQFIFVLQREDHIVLGGLLFGLVGGAAMAAAARRHDVDWRGADPDILSSYRDSLVILRAAVNGVGITKGSYCFSLFIEYVGPNGHPMKFVGDLDPPDEQLREWKQHRIIGKEATELYASQTRSIIEAAMSYRSPDEPAWSAPGNGQWGYPQGPSAGYPPAYTPPPSATSATIAEERGPRCPRCGERTKKEIGRSGWVCQACRVSMM